MLKHVGKHGDRKVVIAYRQVPGEDHMALVTYTDTLPSMVHDELMKAVESNQGQATNDISNVLFRTTMQDGNTILESLHNNGWLKKVQTTQVTVTPTSQSSIKLNELNDLVLRMADGTAAAEEFTATTGEPVADTNVLSDEDLAKSNLEQAKQMRTEAEGLLNEAKRLENEAKALTLQAKATNVRTRTAKKTQKA